MDIENAIEIEVDTSSESSIPTEIEKAGPAGLSAYQIAVKDGFVGTEEEWLSSLKGDPGETGATGQPGPQGLPGRDGAIQYTAGDNITIENNVISASGGDLSNYYTKSEVDNKIHIIPSYYLDMNTNSDYSPNNVLFVNDNTTLSNLSNILNDAYSKGFRFINLTITKSNGKEAITTTYTDTTGLMFQDLQQKPSSIYWKASSATTRFSASGRNIIRRYEVYLMVTWNGEVATAGPIRITPYDLQLLPINNQYQYTPSSDYNPATKKYVDDKPTTYTSYDASKTQVLKNINGTLTWVDE